MSKIKWYVPSCKTMYPFASPICIWSGVSYFSMWATFIFRIYFASHLLQNIVPVSSLILYACFTDVRNLIPNLWVVRHYLSWSLETILLHFPRVNSTHKENFVSWLILFVTSYLASLIGFLSLKSFSGTYFKNPSFILLSNSHPHVFFFWWLLPPQIIINQSSTAISVTSPQL